MFHVCIALFLFSEGYCIISNLGAWYLAACGFSCLMFLDKMLVFERKESTSHATAG